MVTLSLLMDNILTSKGFSKFPDFKFIWSTIYQKHNHFYDKSNVFVFELQPFSEKLKNYWVKKCLKDFIFYLLPFLYL